jgi:hypothetical protein
VPDPWCPTGIAGGFIQANTESEEAGIFSLSPFAKLAIFDVGSAAGLAIPSALGQIVFETGCGATVPSILWGFWSSSVSDSRVHLRP